VFHNIFPSYKMGAAFSSNIVQDTIQESNTAVTSGYQNFASQNTQICQTFNNQQVNIGTIPPCTSQGTIAGKVDIEQTSNTVCKFDNNASANYLQSTQNNFTNASQATVTQLNNLLQEAGSFSVADSTNQTQIINQLFNNMYQDSVQNINSTCLQSLVQVNNQQLVFCDNVAPGGEYLQKQQTTQSLTGNCVAATVFNQGSKNTANNSVINTINQTNIVKQRGFLSFIAAGILFLLILGVGFGTGTKTVQSNNTTKTIFYIILIFLLFALGAAIALGIYYLIKPPENTIDPIVIDDSNRTICVKFLNKTCGNNLNCSDSRPSNKNDNNFQTPDDKFYSVSIPAGTYGDGSTLAAAIQNAINATMYSIGSSVENFFDGLLGIDKDPATIQRIEVIFLPKDASGKERVMQFKVLSGTDANATDRFNLKFQDCSNSIYKVINGTNLLTPPNGFAWTPSDVISTGSLPLTQKPPDLWFWFRVIFGGIGAILLLGLLIFGILSLTRGTRGTGAATGTGTKPQAKTGNGTKINGTKITNVAPKPAGPTKPANVAPKPAGPAK
jgi:hypothetical protein